MRATDIESQHSWFLATAIVQERAGSQKRFNDALRAPTERQLVFAAWEIIRQAARRATQNPEEALAMIGELSGLRNASWSNRCARAAAARKPGNANGKHWASRHAPTVKRLLAIELEEMVTRRGGDSPRKEGGLD